MEVDDGRWTMDDGRWTMDILVNNLPLNNFIHRIEV